MAAQKRDKPIKTLSSNIVWECPWYRVRHDNVILPDGEKNSFFVMEKPSSVFIVPVLATGEIVLIENYRHTLGQWCLEVPAGAIEPGQTPEEAAHEELRQEIGGTAADLKHLLHASTMNGTGSHYTHYFLATGVILSDPDHEAMEFIDLKITPQQEALQLARTGKMNDSISVLALLLAEPHLLSPE